MYSAQAIRSNPAWALTSLGVFHQVLFVICAASSLVSIVQWLGWHPFPEWNTLHPAGLFYNSMAQGEILALAILSFLVWRERWYIPLLIPGLILSNSRGALAALGLGLIAHWFRRPLVILIVTLAVTNWFLLHPNLGDLQRLIIWRAAWDNLTFWGNGLGSFWDLYMGNPAWHPEYVHNDYLQAVFELGIFSVPIFICLALAVVFDRRAQAWPVLIAFLFMGLFSMPIHMPFTAGIGLVALVCTIINLKGESYGSLENKRRSLSLRSHAG